MGSEYLLCLIPIALLLIPILAYTSLRGEIAGIQRELAELHMRLRRMESQAGRTGSDAPIETRKPPAPELSTPAGPSEEDRSPIPRPSAAPPSPSSESPTPPLASPSTPSRASASDGPSAELPASQTAPEASPFAEAERPRSRSQARPEPPIRFEELLGTRLYVWLGAIALALAGIFLVRYAIDQGWLVPTVRVSLGLVLGLGLLGSGERARHLPRIGEALSAAGVAVMMASFYAATQLYALLPPGAGFLLMGLTALVGVGLSLRQGPIVAVVGLVGGYSTPILVGSADRPGPALLAYLLLLLTAVGLVGRRRGWWPLAAASLGAGLLWVLLWIAMGLRAGDPTWLGLYLLASFALMLALGWQATDPEEPARQAELRRYLIPLSLLATLLVQLRLGFAADYSNTTWLFTGLLCAASLLLGRLREEDYARLPWMTGALAAVMLLAWPLEGSMQTRIAPADADPGPRFLWTVAAFGALYALAAYAAIRGSERAPRWTALSATAALAAYLLAYLAHRSELEPPWGPIAIALAALAILACWPLLQRRKSMAGGNDSLAYMAAGASAFLALAVPIELPREWLAAAWALELLALCWLALRLDVPQLRRLVWPLAGLVGLGLLGPWVLTYEIGRLPLLNWIGYGYGLPILALVAAAELALAAEDEEVTRLTQWLAILLGLAFASLQLRQLFSPGDLLELSGFDFFEAASYGIAWLLLALGLLQAGRRWPGRVPPLAAGLLANLALLELLFLPAIFLNPLWTHASVGSWPILNRLLFAYGMPAILALVAARSFDEAEGEDRDSLRPSAVVSLIFALLWLSLQVRQLFHGRFLDEPALLPAESYSYSLAWVLFGSLLLGLAVWRGTRLARWASLPVMLIAVAKVFLFDTANLGGMFRVLSFLGLGSSLILLGWVYQRFVFRQDER